MKTNFGIDEGRDGLALVLMDVVTFSLYIMWSEFQIVGVWVKV